MMQSQPLRLLRSVIISISIYAASVKALTGPLEIPFNLTSTIGPDGPWNFMTLSVGSNSTSNVSFFPQTQGDISILTSATFCDSDLSRCVSNAEYFDGQAASTEASAPNLEISWQQLDNTTRLGQSNYSYIEGNVSFWEEALNAPLSLSNITVLIAENTSTTLGRVSYPPISLLQLNSNSNKNWDGDLNKTEDGTQQGPSLTWPVQKSSLAGRPESYNLHLGSAMFDQPGSLYFGGYDSKRIVDQMYPFLPGKLSLGNISFETVSGQSPWQNNDIYNAFALAIYVGKVAGLVLAPEFPYLLMTPSICSAMETYLPIYQDPETNLYLWSQGNPKYHEIMSSSSYINFTIGTGNDTAFIKVPFASLNLTLEPPITKTSVPYFPCYPFATDTLVFGRAFLQSVNLGYSEDSDSDVYQYLGQAPGPSIGRNTTPEPVSFSTGQYVIPSDAPSWEETWAGTWAELSGNTTTASPNSQSTPSPATPHKGLGGGAIAGIVIGVVVAIAIAAGGLWFGLLRRSHWSKNTRSMNPPDSVEPGPQFQKNDGPLKTGLEGTYRSEKDGPTRFEADDGLIRHEMSATSGPVELPAQMP